MSTADAVFDPTRFNLLDGLTAMNKEALADALAALTTKKFEPGEVINLNGAADSSLCVVLEGQVKLYSRRGPDTRQRQRLTAVIGPGEVFGGAGTQPSNPVFKADRSTPVRLGIIDQGDLAALCFKHPEFAALAVQVLSRITIGLFRRNEALLVGDAPGRLAWTIAEMATQLGAHCPDYVWLSTDLTQSEWAELSGATRETINKAFGDFTNKGWLTVHGRGLKIHNLDALRDRGE